MPTTSADKDAVVPLVTVTGDNWVGAIGALDTTKVRVTVALWASESWADSESVYVPSVMPYADGVNVKLRPCPSAREQIADGR